MIEALFHNFCSFPNAANRKSQSSFYVCLARTILCHCSPRYTNSVTCSSSWQSGLIFIVLFITTNWKVTKLISTNWDFLITKALPVVFLLLVGELAEGGRFRRLVGLDPRLRRLQRNVLRRRKIPADSRSEPGFTEWYRCNHASFVSDTISILS